MPKRELQIEDRDLQQIRRFYLKQTLKSLKHPNNYPGMSLEDLTFWQEYIKDRLRRRD